MEISTTSGTGGSTSCTLLDKPTGFKCLSALLGVGSNRLEKKASGNPDLRFGKHEHKSRPGTWTVDGFLQVAYNAIAETLPDEFLVPTHQETVFWTQPYEAPLQQPYEAPLQLYLILYIFTTYNKSLTSHQSKIQFPFHNQRPRFVRRGRASHRKRDLGDNDPSDWEEVASDVENKEELREWLATESCKTTLLPHNQLVRKWLPPGTVMDLYEHYKSTQAMLGSHAVSHLEQIQNLAFCLLTPKVLWELSKGAGSKYILGSCPILPRYSTFNDVFKRRWSDVLHFRSRSLFTTCEVCSALKEELSDKSRGVEDKLQSLQQYRFHLHSQYADRSALWQLQSQSSEPDSEVLFISTDGLDQAKFALPRYPGLRANASVSTGMNPVFFWVHPESPQITRNHLKSPGITPNPPS